MAKKILLVVYLLVIFLVIGGIVYNIWFLDGSEPIFENRTLITLAVSFFYGITKLNKPSSTRRSLKFYEKFYADTIKSAFSDNKKLRKKMLQSLANYNVNKYEKAINQLIELEPLCKTSDDIFVVNFYLGINYTEVEQIDKAIERYEYLIQVKLADSSTFSNLSILYNKKREYEKSIKVCNLAIQFDPKNEYAYHNFASVLFRVGDYEKSIENLEEAIKINNKFSASLELLAIIYYVIGNTEQGEIYKKRAIASGISKKSIEDAISSFV